eukprot:42626_1
MAAFATTNHVKHTDEALACYTYNTANNSLREVHRLFSLCQGYSRCMRKLHIPLDIISLCVSYANHIPNIIDPIRSTANYNQDMNMIWLCSDVFDYKSFNFLISMCPNWKMYKGYSQMTWYDRDAERSRKQFVWILHSTGFPRSISKIRIKFTVSFQLKTEQNKIISHTTTDECDFDTVFNGYSFRACRKNARSTDTDFVWDFIIENDVIAALESFQFTMHILKFEVFDEEDHICESYDHHPMICLNDYTLQPNGYHWIITDALQMKTIQQADIRQSVSSPVFVINEFGWILQLYPNSVDDDRYQYEDEEQYMHMVLHLVKLPACYHAHGIAIYWKLCFDNQPLNHGMAILNVFTETSVNISSSSNDNGSLTTVDLQQKQYPYFYIEITIINVLDAQGNAIDITKFEQHCKELPCLPTRHYPWHISDPLQVQKIKECAPGQSVLSECFTMYSLNWMLELQPNTVYLDYYQNDSNPHAVILKLHLCTFPHDIWALSFRLTLQFDDIRHTSYVLTHELWSPGNWSWSRHCLLTQDITELTDITFSVSIDLICVFDHQFTDVTSKYISDTTVEPIQLMVPLQIAWNVMDCSSAAVSTTKPSLLTGYPLRFIQPAKDALSAIFAHFARTECHRETASMRRKDMKKYAQCCAGGSVRSARKTRDILYRMHSDGLFIKNGLTLGGFLRYYQMKYEKDANAVWSDLHRFGYDNSLTSYTQDTYVLKAILCSMYYAQSCISGVYEMFHCKWYLKIKDSFLTLHLLSTHPDISYISCLCVLSAKHCIFSQSQCQLFGTAKNASLRFEKQIHTLNISELEFTVKMILFDIYDADDNVITHRFVDRENEEQMHNNNVVETVEPMRFIHHQYQWRVQASVHSARAFMQYTEDVFHARCVKGKQQEIVESFCDGSDENIDSEQIMNIPWNILNAYKQMVGFAMEIEDWRFKGNAWDGINNLSIEKQIMLKMQKVNKHLLSNSYDHGDTDYIHYEEMSECFDVHGLQWYLSLHKHIHSQTKISIHLKSLPHNIKEVTICCKLVSLATSFGLSDILIFDHDNLSKTFDLHSKILDLTDIVFETEIHLISKRHVYNCIVACSAVLMLDQLITFFGGD